MYTVTYKLKHSTYKYIMLGREGVGCCFDAIIIIILISINYSINMSYSFEIQHLSRNICQYQLTINIHWIQSTVTTKVIFNPVLSSTI